MNDNNSDDKVVNLKGEPIKTNTSDIGEGGLVTGDAKNELEGIKIKTFHIEYKNGKTEVVNGWLFWYPTFFSIGDNTGAPILLGPVDALVRIKVTPVEEVS